MDSKESDMEYGAKRQSDGSYIDNAGTIFWYNSEGKYHRDDGPAVIMDSIVSWHLNGEWYSFKGWLKALPISDEDKMLLRLQYE